MKLIKTSFKVLIVLTLFSISCKGPQGDVGPAGSQGSQGAAGAAGAKGDKGDPGTANVFTSAWQTVKPTDWFTYEEDPGFFEVFFLDKNVTADLLEKGLFICFARITEDPTAVFPMPISNLKGQWNYYLYNDPKDPETGVGIYIDYYDNRKTYDTSLDFRWIFVPTATIKNGRKKNVNWNDYEEVKRELNLKD